jgi:hypothetical protein
MMMRVMRRPFLAVFLFAFDHPFWIVSLSYILVDIQQNVMGTDASQYITSAQNLLEGRGFSERAVKHRMSLMRFGRR